MLHIGINVPGLLTLALAIRLPGASHPAPPPTPSEFPPPARSVIETTGAEVLDMSAARARRAA